MILERVLVALKPRTADIGMEMRTGSALVEQGEAIEQAVVDRRSTGDCLSTRFGNRGP